VIVFRSTPRDLQKTKHWLKAPYMWIKCIKWLELSNASSGLIKNSSNLGFYVLICSHNFYFITYAAFWILVVYFREHLVHQYFSSIFLWITVYREYSIEVIVCHIHLFVLVSILTSHVFSRVLFGHINTHGFSLFFHVNTRIMLMGPRLRKKFMRRSTRRIRTSNIQPFL
jgi:hypothetical protein